MTSKQSCAFLLVARPPVGTREARAGEGRRCSPTVARTTLRRGAAGFWSARRGASRATTRTRTTASRSSACAARWRRSSPFPIADLPACIETLSEGDCDEVLSDVSGACQRERGSRPAGEPCVSGGECSSGVCLFSGTLCGECSEVAEVGDPCGDVGVSCTGPGLACDPTSQECAEIVVGDLGAPCGAAVTEPCRADLVCSGGECVEPLDEGEDCSLDPARCDFRRSLTCIDDQCQPFDVVALGESCGSDWPFPRCSDYAYHRQPAALWHVREGLRRRHRGMRELFLPVQGRALPLRRRLRRSHDRREQLQHLRLPVHGYEDLPERLLPELTCSAKGAPHRHSGTTAGGGFRRCPRSLRSRLPLRLRRPRLLRHARTLEEPHYNRSGCFPACTGRRRGSLCAYPIA